VANGFPLLGPSSKAFWKLLSHIMRLEWVTSCRNEAFSVFYQIYVVKLFPRKQCKVVNKSPILEVFELTRNASSLTHNASSLTHNASSLTHNTSSLRHEQLTWGAFFEIDDFHQSKKHKKLLAFKNFLRDHIFLHCIPKNSIITLRI